MVDGYQNGNYGKRSKSPKPCIYRERRLKGVRVSALEKRMILDALRRMDEADVRNKAA